VVEKLFFAFANYESTNTVAAKTKNFNYAPDMLAAWNFLRF
jgi:hypothetical protein